MGSVVSGLSCCLLHLVGLGQTLRRPEELGETVYSQSWGRRPDHGVTWVGSPLCATADSLVCCHQGCSGGRFPSQREAEHVPSMGETQCAGVFWQWWGGSGCSGLGNLTLYISDTWEDAKPGDMLEETCEKQGVLSLLARGNTCSTKRVSALYVPACWICEQLEILLNMSA